MGIPSPNISQTPPAGDQANAVVTGSFTGTGTSGIFCPFGPFNCALWGDNGPNGAWNAAVQLECSFDGGTTWIAHSQGPSGALAVYPSASGAAGQDYVFAINEPERGVLYRWDCTVHTSGTINYRLSATGQAATSLSVPVGA